MTPRLATRLQLAARLAAAAALASPATSSALAGGLHKQPVVIGYAPAQPYPYPVFYGYAYPMAGAPAYSAAPAYAAAPAYSAAPAYAAAPAYQMSPAPTYYYPTPAAPPAAAPAVAGAPGTLPAAAPGVKLSNADRQAIFDRLKELNAGYLATKLPDDYRISSIRNESRSLYASKLGVTADALAAVDQVDADVLSAAASGSVVAPAASTPTTTPASSTPAAAVAAAPGYLVPLVPLVPVYGKPVHPWAYSHPHLYQHFAK